MPLAAEPLAGEDSCHPTLYNNMEGAATAGAEDLLSQPAGDCCYGAFSTSAGPPVSAVLWMAFFLLASLLWQLQLRRSCGFQETEVRGRMFPSLSPKLGKSLSN